MEKQLPLRKVELLVPEVTQLVNNAGEFLNSGVLDSRPPVHELTT